MFISKTEEHMGNRLRIILILALVVAFAAAPVHAAPARAGDPESVVRAIFDALNAGDVKAAVANVADGGVLVLMPPEIAAPGPNVIQGKQAITDWWTFIVSDKGRFEIFDTQVDGDKVSWKAEMSGAYFDALNLDPLQAEGVGIVEDGKLKSYIWNVSKESMARLAAASNIAGNKEVVTKWLTAWEAGDDKTMATLLADDFVNNSPPFPEDKAGMIAAGVENHEQFPAGKYTIKSIMADGDMVSLYGNFTGAHTGKPLLGIPAKGAKANFDFSLLFRLEDGKIAERWAASESVTGMLVPLGFKLVPPE